MPKAKLPKYFLKKVLDQVCCYSDVGRYQIYGTMRCEIVEKNLEF